MNTNENGDMNESGSLRKTVTNGYYRLLTVSVGYRELPDGYRRLLLDSVRCDMKLQCSLLNMDSSD